MSSTTDRARDRDRDAAIRTVDAALASGRIIRADRDKRVEEIRYALTLQDIAIQLGELATPAQVTAYAASPVAAVAPPGVVPAVAPAAAPAPAPAPAVVYGPPLGAPGSFPAAQVVASRVVRRIRRTIAIAVLVSVVVPVLVAVVALVSTARNYDFEGTTGTTPTDDSTYLPGQAPGPRGVNVLSTDGYQSLVTAVRDRTGGTTVDSAYLFPTYAVVEVADPSGAGQPVDYYWDGRNLAGSDSVTTTSDPGQPVDLAAVDPQVIVDQLTLVRSRMTDPDTWYSTVDHPADSPPQVTSLARNAANDTSFTVVGLDGTVIYDSAASGG